jgi:AraC family transcriptional regulator of adaptative response / methylphosphotriester-DNA alkyltransferase methyltransferase
MSNLDEDEKWRAVTSRDAAYDERFLYGVKTTGIYCLPSCSSKKPLRRNVVFFDDMDQARERGFRPCRKCRPDSRSGGRPEAVVERLRKACLLSLSEAPVRPGEMSPRPETGGRALTRLFKKHQGKTLNQYLTSLRIEKAKAMLTGTGTDILQISFDCGFDTLSNFYRSFKLHTGMPPGQYRRIGGLET